MASVADRFDCYQKSVQTPDHEVVFFEQAYRDAYKSTPLDCVKIFVERLQSVVIGLRPSQSEQQSVLISVLKPCNGT